MTERGTSARATLDAWREQQADRFDAVRFHFMVALEKRVASHEGDVRQLLDDRLSCLLDAYACDLDLAAGDGVAADKAATSRMPVRGALGGLVDQLASHAATRGNVIISHDAAFPASSFPALPALDTFRQIWSRIRVDSQLRETLEQVPSNAGPLNSGALVHRAIALMQELSPGYLQQFLSYVDTLSWIEQMNAGGALLANDAPSAIGARKRTRDKPRKRRE